MLLSIIIPVYNTEKYVAQCIDSCLNQDLDDYEIICVDDGSTDNSSQILDNYAKQYSRIKVLHTKNGGVSRARNNGIKAANGKWLWFVDSDDIIMPMCLSKLYKVLSQSKGQLLNFDSQRVRGFNEVPSRVDKEVPIKYCKDTYDILTNYTTNNYGNGPVFYWFEREIILRNGIMFDECLRYAEDTKFLFEYKINCTYSIIYDTPIYFYRQHNQSAMHNVNYEEHLLAMEELCFVYKKALSNTHDGRIKKILNRNIEAAMNAVLFDLLFYIRQYDLAKEKLKQFERQGFYPSQIISSVKLTSLFKNKNKKQILINLLYRTFTFKRFYLFMCWMLAKR